MIYLKKIIAAAIFVIVGAVNAPAYATDQTETGIQSLIRDLAQFSQQVQGIYAGQLELMNYSFAIDDLSSGLEEGEISTSFANSQYLKLNSVYQSKRKLLKQAISNLPSIEDKPAKFKELTHNMLSYIKEFHEQLDDMHLNSVEQYQAVMKGEKTEDNYYLRRQFEQMLVMLDSENNMMRIQQNIISENDIEVQKYETIVHGNNAIINIFQGLMDFLATEEADALDAARNQAHENIEKMRQTIERARALKSDEVRKLSFYKPTSAFGRKLNKTMLEAMKTYDDTFDTEAEIANIIEDISNSIAPDALGEASDTFFDTVQVKIEAAINDRIMHQTKRMAILSQIGN